MEIRTPNNQEFEIVKIRAKRMALDLTHVKAKQFVCAFTKAGLVGFVRILPKNKLKEVATLGVLKEFRRKGVGKLLIFNLQKHYTKLHLVTVIPRYFEKQGFFPVDKVPKELKEKFNNCELWHGYGEPTVMQWEAEFNRKKW